MAVNRVWLEAARPVRGSMRLIGLRWLLWIVAALPGAAIGMGALAQGPAAASALADAPQPFPLADLIRFVSRVPPLVWGVSFVGMLLAWKGHQLLTAGAIAILSPPTPERPRVRGAVLDTGMRFLLRFVRVAALAAVWLSLTVMLARRGFEAIGQHGERAGWSARTMSWTLPIAQSIMLLVLASAVGACGTWCRVLFVAEDRRYLRRLQTIVPRICARWPVQGFALQIALMSLSVLLAATVLFAWRQSGAGHTASWVVAWLLVLLVQSFVWHWRHRICCELWAAGRDRWAGIPDEPWHLPRRMWSWIRRFRASRGARGDADADGIPPQRPDAAT